MQRNTSPRAFEGVGLGHPFVVKRYLRLHDKCDLTLPAALR